jgi:hypothetical protein
MSRIRSSVPRDHQSASALGKSLWQLGPVGQVEEEGNVYLRNTRAWTNLVALSLGLGVEEPDGGPG